MSFSVQDLYTDKTHKYGASESSEDFQLKFMEALNYALDDLEAIGRVTVARVDSLEEDISLDEHKFKGVVSSGIDVYLHQYNEYNVMKYDVLSAIYSRKLATAKRLNCEDGAYYGKKGDLS